MAIQVQHMSNETVKAYHPESKCWTLSYYDSMEEVKFLDFKCWSVFYGQSFIRFHRKLDFQTLMLGHIWHEISNWLKSNSTCNFLLVLKFIIKVYLNIRLEQVGHKGKGIVSCFFSYEFYPKSFSSSSILFYFTSLELKI